MWVDEEIKKAKKRVLKKAWIPGTDMQCTVGYDHSLFTDQAHQYGALYLLSHWFEGERLVPVGRSYTKNGWQFIFSFES